MRLSRPFTDDVRITALAVMGAVQFSEEGFPLKVHREHPDWDLPLSPYYVNLRLVPEGPLTTEQARLFGQDLGWLFYVTQVYTRQFPDRFQIVGVPNTGKPLAEGFAHIWPEPDKIRLLEMLKEGEGKGKIARVLNGNPDRDLPIVMVDDVVTKGGSKLEALGILESMGYKVPICTIVVDREQGSKEELAGHGIELVSATTFSDVLGECRNLGLIAPEMYMRSIEYPSALDAAIAAKQTT